MYCLRAALTLPTRSEFALLHPDAVDLVGEPLPDHLQLALVLGLGGEARQDHVIGGDRVDLAVGQGVHAVGEPGLLEQFDVAQEVARDVGGRGGARHRAQRLAVQRLRAGDLGVVAAHQQVLVGHEVRPGEVHDLLALVGDGEGGDDQVRAAGLQQLLALVGVGFLPGDVVPGHPQGARDVDGGVHVEPGVGVTGPHAQPGLVERDPDRELPAGRARHRRGRGVRTAATPRAARGQHHQRRGQPRHARATSSRRSSDDAPLSSSTSRSSGFTSSP